MNQSLPGPGAAAWPEPLWLWRRVYAFAATAALLFIEHEAVAQSLPWPVHACILGLGVMSLTLAYMVGATGEVWVRMSQGLAARNAASPAPAPAGKETK